MDKNLNKEEYDKKISELTKKHSNASLLLNTLKSDGIKDAFFGCTYAGIGIATLFLAIFMPFMASLHLVTRVLCSVLMGGFTILNAIWSKMNLTDFFKHRKEIKKLKKEIANINNEIEILKLEKNLNQNQQVKKENIAKSSKQNYIHEAENISNETL